MHAYGFSAAVLLAGAVGACDQPAIERSGTAPLRERVGSRAYVTAAAAAALDASGHFSRAGRVPRSPDELSEAQAVALTSTYVKNAGPYLKGAWEYTRGAPITLAALVPCDGAHYAATPYADPPGDSDRGVRIALDSKWIVEFCNASVPVLNVAVASHATNIQTSATGRLQIPGSNPFYSFGIPASMRGSVPSPDSAVQVLAQMTGVPVAREPEFVLPAFPYSPQLARWRVTLAAPVRVRNESSKVVDVVQEVYHGYTDSWGARGIMASTSDAPAPAAVLRWQDAATGAERLHKPVARPGYTVNLTPVEAQP